MNDLNTKQIECRFCKKEIHKGAVKCPHCQSDLRNWFRRHWIISSLLFIFIVPTIFSSLIVAINGDKQKISEAKATKEQAVIWDITKLSEFKTIEEVKNVLGLPTNNDKKPTAGLLKITTEWDVEYKKDGESLLVTYDYKTGKIKDYFLTSKEGENKLDNSDHKAKIARKLNLYESLKDYNIEYVKGLKDPNYFTGIIVSKADPLANAKEYNARFYSSSLIKNGVILKSPSSAKYATPTYAKLVGENTYEVTSYVDSQNSYGAEIRSDWYITLKYIGPEELEKVNYITFPQNWKVISGTFDGEKIK
jgi:hypothetical protein